MRPKIFYGNLFALGVLSGSMNSYTNPVRRVADGSINLSYQLTSGLVSGLVGGAVAVTLPVAMAPDAFVLPKGSTASGHQYVLESEDVGGGNNATVFDFTLSGATDRFVQEISGATPRRVWRLTVNGVSGLDHMSAREMQLASLLEMPRSPEVSVTRTRVRQFTRLPIAGGQPFVKRDGPRLRQTRFSFVVVSGAELLGVEAFVDDIEGGESFTITDDLAQTYWAELLGTEQPFDDEAGVYRVGLAVREIRAD